MPTNLFDELLLGTVANDGLHLISRQLRPKYCFHAHRGVWTVDDEIAASVELGAEHRFVQLRFYGDGAAKTANGL